MCCTPASETFAGLALGVVQRYSDVESSLLGSFGIDLTPRGWEAPVRVGHDQLEPPAAEDVALFLHTSGTTSRPKGVPLSHGNLAASLDNIASTYCLSSRDRSLLVMPLFHVHGLMAGALSLEQPTKTIIVWRSHNYLYAKQIARTPLSLSAP